MGCDGDEVQEGLIYTFLLLIVQMLLTLATHLLIALVVWLIARRKTQGPSTKPNLSLRRQVNYVYAKEQAHKKRKGKKGKKKVKKEFLQVLSCEDINLHEEARHEESQKQQSEKDEKEQRVAEHIVEPLPKNVENAEINMEKEKVEEVPKEQEKSENIQKKESVPIVIEEKNNELVKSKEQSRLKQQVSEEIELVRNYFMHQLQEIVPYNGSYGHYKLCIEGSKKPLTAQWKYTPFYPKEPLQVWVNKDFLNPLELQTLERIFSEQQEKARLDPQYFYIFNLTTSLFQDLMISINEAVQEQRSLTSQQAYSNANQEFDLKMVHVAPEDIKIKKEIYGKILDEIFYLHDLVEKPDNSALKVEEPLQAKASNARGRYESQFQELQLIGQGGFGKVYRVRHRLDGNIYAIKKAVVNYEDLKDRKMLKEVALLSKLNHPNIVRYYQSWLEDTHNMQELRQDMSFSENQHSKIEELNHIYARWKNDKSGDIRFVASENSYNGSLVQNSGIVFQDGEEDDGIVFEDEEMSVSQGSSIDHAAQGENDSESSLMEGIRGFPFKILYIAMELCTGINLREFINQRFDEEEHKIQILRGILEGLAYIHSKRIMHRDLKPANIFLTDQHKVKIGDFGLATTQDRSISLSLEAEESDFLGDKTKAVGTGYYRAPQQLKSEKYDQKVDIYSLGVIMFQLFYRFRTAMERIETLKELTFSHKLPKQFQGANIGTDLLENIYSCLQEQPDKRPSASKLLEGFRNKYFTQLVSCIANPKHFQFSQLLSHLFAIRNEHGAVLMRRDAYKPYLSHLISRIYRVHRATHFPTLPLLSLQDHTSLNGLKLKATRQGKYLLLTSRGVILEYSSNCLKGWLLYARDAMRKKKGLEPSVQQEAIRRYTFQKVVSWEGATEDKDLQFSEKMVTGFDLAYKLQSGFNPFYFCQVLRVSQSLVLTLNLTQKRPPVLLSHSQLYSLLAQKYRVSAELLYSVLIKIDQDSFTALPHARRVSYLEQRNIPNNFCKKMSQMLDQEFESGEALMAALQLDEENDAYEQILIQIRQVELVGKRIVANQIKWRLGIPPSLCNGFFWEVGVVKGLTTVEEYAPGQEMCNYHIQTGLDQDEEEADVSICCIGQYLEEETQRMVLQCWRNGLSTRQYKWQMGEKEDRCRHSIILRRKNDRVQIMLRHNQQRKGQHESSFISLDQFSMDVIRQMAVRPYI